MIGSAVIGGAGTMPNTPGDLGQLVLSGSGISAHNAPDKTRQELISKMWETAGRYVDDSGLKSAVLEIKDDVMLLMNAPFEGSPVPICAIQYGKVMQYF